MPVATINHGRLEQMVKNAVNGLIASIIQEETKVAQDRLEARIAAETRGLVVKVLSNYTDYSITPEINVVIHLPEQPNAQG